MQSPAKLSEQKASPDADWSPFIPLPVAQAREIQGRLRQRAAVAEIAPAMAYVLGAKESRQALMDPKTFSNVGNFGGDADMPPFVTLLDGAEHAKVRTILNEGFARTAIVEAAPWITELVDNLIDGFKASGGAELVSELSLPLTERVITRLVGVPPQDSAMLADWSLRITAMLPRPRFDTEEWHRIERYIATLLEDRRASGDRPDDMISRLSEARIDGRPFTTKEVTGHVWLLFVGGLESTAYTLSILIHELLADRAQWERLLCDRTLLPGAVEEGLRIATPLRALERQVRRRTEVSGCPIAEGSTLFVGLESANFDETVFGNDARTYRLDRAEAGRHIAFGFGRHTCLGAPLARTEIMAALTRLLERLPQMRLAPGFVLETIPSQFSHIPKRLDVVW